MARRAYSASAGGRRGLFNMGVGLAALMATAASLSMDAFSVSICVGLGDPDGRLKNGLIVGAVFGGFQFLMPLLGGVLANRLNGLMGGFATWIAVGLISLVAVKMFYEACRHVGECSSPSLDARNLLLLGLATSLDALAVGFSVKSAGSSVLMLAVASGIITFAVSLLGNLGGGALGAGLGVRAQHLGGAVLLVIAAGIALG